MAITKEKTFELEHLNGLAIKMLQDRENDSTFHAINPTYYDHDTETLESLKSGAENYRLVYFEVINMKL